MKILEWKQLSSQSQQDLLRRPSRKNAADIVKKTADIIAAVQSQGDQALRTFTAQYDGVEINNFKVSETEWIQAQQKVSNTALHAIQQAMAAITAYHEEQKPNILTMSTHCGVICERHPRPIQRVGLYVPGGSAPLVSTVMMLAIPAKIAECHTRILCTPANKNGNIDPHLLVTARLCGIRDIYKIGGAQAIAALAYGTESIPKVDKIFGPGNAWVTQAKIQVTQDPQGARCDLPAGPSELLVIADDSANPAFVAADLLSQAEHGTDSQVILLTTSSKLAHLVQNALSQQLPQLSRQIIASQALAHGAILITETIQQALTISNDYAPEHLMLQVEHPQRWVDAVQCAGAVFLGPWTPETLGDYITGSNHVLPTNGYARSISGLSLSDFMTFLSVQAATEEGFIQVAPFAAQLAEIEGLTAHQEAVIYRQKHVLLAMGEKE